MHSLWHYSNIFGNILDSLEFHKFWTHCKSNGERPKVKIVLTQKTHHGREGDISYK
jgi:hypothetical protein